MSETAKQFSIQRIYVKDLSFESPNAPTIFTGQAWSPEVNIQLNTETTTLEAGMFEVVLKVTVTAKVEEKTAFLVEVEQAGIFSITGFDQAEMGHMLGSYAPNLLFPYAREAVSDLVGRGSFPQMLLSPVNFDALYAQHLQQQQEKAQEQEAVH